MGNSLTHSITHQLPTHSLPHFIHHDLPTNCVRVRNTLKQNAVSLFQSPVCVKAACTGCEHTIAANAAAEKAAHFSLHAPKSARLSGISAAIQTKCLCPPPSHRCAGGRAGALPARRGVPRRPDVLRPREPEGDVLRRGGRLVRRPRLRHGAGGPRVVRGYGLLRGRRWRITSLSYQRYQGSPHAASLSLCARVSAPFCVSVPLSLSLCTLKCNQGVRHKQLMTASNLMRSRRCRGSLPTCGCFCF